MASIHPDWRTIGRGHQPPTQGEITFLKFLEANLNDEYEIYFQPYLNGDRPDIILMRKGGGVLIIEVKDFNFSLYHVDEKTNWRVKTKDKSQIIKSPFNQAFSYKDNLFNLHSKELIAAKIRNAKAFNMVACAVFFSKATYQQFEDLAINPFKGNNEYSKYLRFLSFFEVYTSDTLNAAKLNQHLRKTWISRKSILFKDKYYESIKRYVQPPYHYEEEGVDITYTKGQSILIQSAANKRQKIKGVAGCGKTFVLAKRAVNAHVRTGGKILILTYNLSLVNYIRDRISDVKANFNWSNFNIINYHQFFKTAANNYSLTINSFDDWNNPTFFKSVKSRISKYDAVFIDEVQDYKTEWLDLINTYFVSPNAEYVVFGDEKQNIYDRPLDNEKNVVAKGIPGRWNKSLRASLRFTKNIAKLAARFQQVFLKGKYNLEQMAIINQTGFGFNNQLGKLSRIDYYRLNNGALAPDFKEVIKNYITLHNIHSSDVGVLGSTIDNLRELDFLLRKDMSENTTVTFENKEFFDNHNLSKDELNKLRRVKKMYFFMKTGTMKISTIHSFKGWDIPTLFLLIDDSEIDHQGFTTHELIYTAITRARYNLIVINGASEKYDTFFSKEIAAIA